jgi:hypothetical protein
MAEVIWSDRGDPDHVNHPQPEFLAMGLFADTAFFDMLVVA